MKQYQRERHTFCILTLTLCIHAHRDTHRYTLTDTQTHRHTHTAFSLNFFPHLSSYSLYPTHLFYAFVCVCLCSSVSFKFPLHSPCFLLSPSVYLAPSPEMLVLARHVLQCWRPLLCGAAGLAARRQGTSAQFHNSAPLGASSGISEERVRDDVSGGALGAF